MRFKKMSLFVVGGLMLLGIPPMRAYNAGVKDHGPHWQKCVSDGVWGREDWCRLKYVVNNTSNNENPAIWSMPFQYHASYIIWVKNDDGKVYVLRSGRSKDLPSDLQAFWDHLKTNHDNIYVTWTEGWLQAESKKNI